MWNEFLRCPGPTGWIGVLVALAGFTVAPAAAAQTAARACEPPRIRSIRIERAEVFPQVYGSMGWFYRLGNKIHIDTRESVVRRELLFREGEPLDLDNLAQSERNLRSRRFIAEARVRVVSDDGEIRPAALPAGRLCAEPGKEEVDVVVFTRDSWSLQLDFGVAKKGNRWLWQAGVTETNFLGTGKRVGLGYDRGVDRDSFGGGFHDPQVLGSPHELWVDYRTQSDGHRFSLFGGRYFRGLDEAWSYDARTVSFDQFQPLYEAGEQIGGLRHRRRHYAAQGGGAIVRRRASALRAFVGVRSEFDDVEVEIRDFGIVQTGVTFTQHRFRQLRWIDHERPVDVNLGVGSGLWLGYAVRNESTRSGDTFFLAATHSQGVPLGDSRFVRGDVSWTSRIRDGSTENGMLRADVVFVDHAVERRALLVRGRVVWGVRLDPEVQVTLGADRGLRGYRVNEFVGDRSVLLTAEYRAFFVEDVDGFFSLGAAAFVDSGYAWARGVPTRWSDLRTDAGISLLLGYKQRTTANAGARIDLAYAFDPIPDQSRWVLSFGTTRTF